MIRQLEHKTEGGAVYIRPKRIEESIGAALQLAPEAVQRRAKISNENDPEYLPPECLVYLIREAGRKRAQPLITDLMQTLWRRCARTLMRRFPDSAHGAGEIREAVQAKFNELVLEDVKDGNRHDLDFYEVRFNAAFASLCKDASESVWKRLKREVPLSPPAPGEQAVVGQAGAAPVQDERTTDEPPDVMALQRLSTALGKLPDPERQAIKLRFFDGLDVESVDPTEVTVASKLRVSGKTVRNRLARAFAILCEMMETKHD